MPKVELRVKRKGGKTYKCDSCGEPIEPRQSYYTWSFRYGGSYHRHEKPGYPRQSELTQSKMSGVYAAIEHLHDNSGTWETPEDAKNAAEEVANTVREVMAEYEEAAESFGGQGENQERAEQLEGFADELESWEPPDLADYEDEDGDVDLDDWREAATSEVPECPL